jgi:hypothetical protein
MFKLAVTPATTRQQAASKKSMIGRVWLNAEGEIDGDPDCEVDKPAEDDGSAEEEHAL